MSSKFLLPPSERGPSALVLNGTFRSALVQDLGARGAKEAIAAEARMKMGL